MISSRLSALAVSFALSSVAKHTDTTIDLQTAVLPHTQMDKQTDTDSGGQPRPDGNKVQPAVALSTLRQAQQAVPSPPQSLHRTHSRLSVLARRRSWKLRAASLPQVASTIVCG